MTETKSVKKHNFDNLPPPVRVRLPVKLLAQILKRNRNLSIFLRSACADAIHFAPIISQAKKLKQDAKVSAMKVVVK